VTTVREAASTFVPIGNAFSVGKLADTIGLDRPISVSDVIRRTKPEHVIFRSGDLGPSTVTGRAALSATSDGFWWFAGEVRESGFFSHDYAFGVVLKFVPPDGIAFASGNQGDVHGTQSVGSRVDHWSLTGYDRRIGTYWDDIKNSSAHFELHVDTDLGQVLEGIRNVLFPPVVLLGLLAQNPQVACALEDGSEPYDDSPDSSVNQPTVKCNPPTSPHSSANWWPAT
jgi:hypothetical protein